MKTLKVTAANITYLKPYQGTKKELKIGDILTVVSKSACVRKQPGLSDSFYQVTDNTLNADSIKTVEWYQQAGSTLMAEIAGRTDMIPHCNRWSINCKRA
jgi:hypothetical protein